MLRSLAPIGTGVFLAACFLFTSATTVRADEWDDLEDIREAWEDRREDWEDEREDYFDALEDRQFQQRHYYGGPYYDDGRQRRYYRHGRPYHYHSPYYYRHYYGRPHYYYGHGYYYTPRPHHGIRVGPLNLYWR